MVIKATITTEEQGIIQRTFGDFKELGQWMEENHGTFTDVVASKEKEAPAPESIATNRAIWTGGRAV